jgi:hypothetical protein
MKALPPKADQPMAENMRAVELDKRCFYALKLL